MILFCFDVPALSHVCWVWACFCFEDSSVFPCVPAGIGTLWTGALGCAAVLLGVYVRVWFIS